MPHVSDLHLAIDHRFSSIYNPRPDINGTNGAKWTFLAYSPLFAVPLFLSLFARRRATNSLPFSSQSANTFEGKAPRSYFRGYIFQTNTVLRPTAIEKPGSLEREEESFILKLYPLQIVYIYI